MSKHFTQNLLTACADELVWFSRAFGRQAWYIFLVIFSFSIVCVMPYALAQAKFSDVQGSWAQPCIEYLAQKQIINGYRDGSFKPDSSVTRAEFASMVSSAFPNASEIRSGGEFIDVPAQYWAKAAIRTAYKMGFLSGYPGGVFNPNEKMPRSQVLVSLASGLKYLPTQPVAKTLNGAFADAQKIPDYARDAIASATEKYLVVNYPNVKILNPNQLTNRVEVAAFLCQALGSSGLVPEQYIAKVGTSAIPTAELRGVWMTNIDSDVLFDRKRLSNSLQRLSELNFNTVYPTVWNWGYTLYPSSVAARVIGRSLDPTDGLKGRDILQEILEQGHQKGMAVIPWFEFGFMAPADSELAKRHQDWLTKRRDGTTIWKEDIYDRVWLNPLHPDVQQFIEDLIVEIVTKYDIDGIQFDDHFGFPSEFGYDDFTVALYKKEHNGQSPSNNAKDPAWIRWRADKVTDCLTRVFKAIKQRKQNCVIAVAPNPLNFSYNYSLADWQTWEQQGLIEELIVQNYQNDLKAFISELERPEIKAAQQHIPVGIGIISGVKPQPVKMAQIQNQVQEVRRRGFVGVSFFFYETLWNLAPEKPDQRQSALKGMFPAPAKRPNLLLGWQPSI